MTVAHRGSSKQQQQAAAAAAAAAASQVPGASASSGGGHEKPGDAPGGMVPVLALPLCGRVVAAAMVEPSLG
jgi:hypothetical protein